MSEPYAGSRLPAHPSLEQLKKQAKDLVRAADARQPVAIARMAAIIPRLQVEHESTEQTLADAQFVLAREHGFGNWAALSTHVAAAGAPEVAQFEQLASDVARAYTAGDFDAIREINWKFGTSFIWDRPGERMHRRLRRWFESADRSEELALADARHLVARMFDADDWSQFVAGVAQRSDGSRQAPLVSAPTPPFYRLDADKGAVHVKRALSAKEWDVVFGVMRERAIPELHAGPLNDEALARIPELSHLTRLHLGGSTTFSDDGVLALSRMPQLEVLELGGWKSPLTDRALEVLRHLPALTSFSAGWTQGITDAGAAHLTFCDELEHVNLMGTPTGDGTINALTGKRHLKQFKAGRNVTDAGIPLLHRFPAFKTWQGGEPEFDLMSFDAKPTDLMLDGPFTNQGLSALDGLDGLYGLGFFWHCPNLSADGLRHLSGLPMLGFLAFGGEHCTDEAMAHIAAIPRLRMLQGQGAVATDAGFRALSKSASLEFFWGRDCPNFGTRGFLALSRLATLKGLGVSCKQVDDGALATLPHFPALRELMPMDVPDEGFRHVGACEKLERLWCMCCRDTGDRATEHIRGLSRLRSYYAGETRITDHSLEILAGMPSLEQLSFWGCPGITDAGAAVLARLPNLREVTFDGTPNVSRAAVRAFAGGVRVEVSG